MLIIALAFNQLVLTVLQLHLHSLDDYACQLLLQTFLLDCEVDQHDLGGDFGLIAGVGKFGGHEQFEVLIVPDIFVSKIDHKLICHFLNGLIQQWFK